VLGKADNHETVRLAESATIVGDDTFQKVFRHC